MNKENLIKELRYALPSSSILKLVSLAIVKIGDEYLVLKSRPGFNVKELSFVKEFSNDEADYFKLHNKAIEIDTSAFNKRGQKAIVEYLSAIESAPKQPFADLDKKLEEKKLIEIEQQLDEWFNKLASGSEGPQKQSHFTEVEKEIKDIFDIVNEVFGKPNSIFGEPGSLFGKSDIFSKPGDTSGKSTGTLWNALEV